VSRESPAKADSVPRIPTVPVATAEAPIAIASLLRMAVGCPVVVVESVWSFTRIPIPHDVT
jgi:hypothetical protein